MTAAGSVVADKSSPEALSGWLTARTAKEAEGTRNKSGVHSYSWETEGLAWSHRGSTPPRPKALPIATVYPRFSTQLCLAQNTL